MNLKQKFDSRMEEIIRYLTLKGFTYAEATEFVYSVLLYNKYENPKIANLDFIERRNFKKMLRGDYSLRIDPNLDYGFKFDYEQDFLTHEVLDGGKFDESKVRVK